MGLREKIEKERQKQEERGKLPPEQQRALEREDIQNDTVKTTLGVIVLLAVVVYAIYWLWRRG